jgi:replicative DNA helicase
MGKTALLEAMVKSSAMDEGLYTGLFTLEMTVLQMADRLISGQSKINGEKIHSLKLSENEWGAMSQAVGQLNESKLYIDDTPSMTLQHVKKEARKLAKKGKLGYLAIDYLTLMQAEKADRNDLAYGIITKELKQLAKELDCCVLLLTQLNRSLENRTDKRPTAADSRDTGQIEQDCDYWVGLYRESVYDDSIQGGAKGYTEALLRLNRYGDTGTAAMMLKHGSFYPCDVMEIGNNQPANQERKF